MNAEYVLLGAPFWRLWNKKVIIWYNHTAGDWKIRLAMKLADYVCHTSPYAFTAGTTKSRQMPAGINTDFFKPAYTQKKSRSVLYLGRIAPVKDLGTLIKAIDILYRQGEGVTLSVYGGAILRDKTYFEEMKRLALPLVKEGVVEFRGSVPNIEAPAVFSSHEIFVNLTPSGNYDKTVLEAMACETLPLVASDAFRDTIKDEQFEFKKNPEELAKSIKRILSLSGREKMEYGAHFRAAVVQKHDISFTVQCVLELFDTVEHGSS
jgi:glycosyltransferase involved in cell wall biosynthesis